MCKGSDRHQDLSSYPVVLVSVARQWNCLELVLAARHPCFAKYISLLTLAAHDFDVTSGGGGTGRLWWAAGGTLVLWIGRAIGIQGYETKEENHVVAEHEEYC